MFKASARLARHIWRGALRLAEAKNGPRYPRINKVTAAVTVSFMFLFIPALVIANQFDTRAHVRHADAKIIGLLCFGWLVLMASIWWQGRERSEK